MAAAAFSLRGRACLLARRAYNGCFGVKQKDSPKRRNSSAAGIVVALAAKPCARQSLDPDFSSGFSGRDSLLSPPSLHIKYVSADAAVP